MAARGGSYRRARRPSCRGARGQVEPCRRGPRRGAPALAARPPEGGPPRRRSHHTSPDGLCYLGYIRSSTSFRATSFAMSDEKASAGIASRSASIISRAIARSSCGSRRIGSASAPERLVKATTMSTARSNVGKTSRFGAQIRWSAVETSRGSLSRRRTSVTAGARCVLAPNRPPFYNWERPHLHLQRLANPLQQHRADEQPEDGQLPCLVRCSVGVRQQPMQSHGASGATGRCHRAHDAGARRFDVARRKPSASLAEEID